MSRRLNAKPAFVGMRNGASAATDSQKTALKTAIICRMEQLK